ncbi:CPBP family intramembrane glutamic endopeptidase [Lysinibacillus telephonicus]|uniref:CPBP family intramembrane metalloprotease n=1 Tax=Lysinibacillus telephonicus TaxID=1714840 RepID=A0A3S0JMN1_9BACI|nr:CPBP family intramembrane glutamic endopeptidase [Lysinibacillus telephonicus]RTQ89740.1 CPBP family intramembrane metalloprotease [Lysinibacillus telephonicus]
MRITKHLIGLLLSLLFIYIMLSYSFEESKVFWYLYTFTLLVGMSIAIISNKFKDELPTWKYFIFGIGYGTILYGIVRLGYILLTNIDGSIAKSISKFLDTYGPTNIWHYLLLIFIVVVGEELFWRGYVQQQLKKWMSPAIAVIITSILFALSVIISGFIPGAVAALFAGVILGTLYEWKQSMPLIIIAHEVFVLLLFMILPLS